MEERLVRSRGDYKSLISYQKADVIYQITYFFCSHFLKRGDRTIDQMIQAARSGKQNIVEGSAAGATSAKTEIKLTSVAKASLQELLEDYEDFLKVNKAVQWQPGSREFEYMRRFGRENSEASAFMDIVATRPATTVADMCIILIKQADYLLFRQIEGLERKFLSEGGFSERMYRLRQSSRTGYPGENKLKK